jgi:flagellar basal-body rod protein FlgB
MGFDRFLFGDPMLPFLERNLNLHQFRAEVIASNLANVDTPEYKALDVDFAKALENARGSVAGELNLQRTNLRHIGVSESEFPVEVVETKEGGSIRVDGNTVDQDKEMQKLADTQTYFTASINTITKKMRMISDALAGKI